MAFKMNPKSPLLMKAMGISPAKNMNKGYGPAKTSSPAKQKSSSSMSDAFDCQLYPVADRRPLSRRALRRPHGPGRGGAFRQDRA